jgi:hypothetical protein
VDPAAAPDEYVSAMTFADDVVNRGAFLDRNPYTRLITYSNLNDLRAVNETFDAIGTGDPRPGPPVTDEDGNPLGYRHPWVYMGPGIHFNAGTGRVHVRLAHTHNNVSGVTDYDDETDPGRTPLALSARDATTLSVSGSSYLRFERLTVTFGGEDTIRVAGCQQLTFDHIRIRAATRGVRIGGTANGPSSDVVFAHCAFDGGIPLWMFRTDRTSGYHFVDGGQVVANNLGEHTSDALLVGSPDSTDVEIHHCNFVQGHDVVVQGKGVNFHDNLLSNLQGDALAFGFDAGTADSPAATRIYRNVVHAALVALRFASTNRATHWYIYRNLFDLRGAIRGFRPRRTGDTAVFRHGLFHASEGDAPGPHDLFQNTVLVYDQREQAAFLHYRTTAGPFPRRSFNNIFVAVNPRPEADRAITFVPPPSFAGPTDGNLYHRMGTATADPFRYLGYQFQGEDFRAGTFPGLAQLRASALFEQSRTQYPPGYEAASLLTDPEFRQIDPDGRPRGDNDLRPGDDSPALGAGIPLPDNLAALDPVQPVADRPDIGCYARDSGPLHVGSDGCEAFPDVPDTPPVRPRRLAGGVWRPVFLHEFLDGDPANLRAAPGELEVLPDGPVIQPTPDPADRGMLMTPGNQLIVYRFQEPFEDVIGVDLSVDILYPAPNPFTEAVFPLVALGNGALSLSLARMGPAIPDPPPGPMPVRALMNVLGAVLQVELLVMPAFADLRTTRYRIRWHTHGQAQMWHEGQLVGYEPQLAAGRSMTVDQLVIGFPFSEPRFAPRYRVRRVYLKLLRRDDAQRAADGQVPINLCAGSPDPCVEQVRGIQREMLSRIRAFMSAILPVLTTPWRAGSQGGGPFSPESIAAHTAAVDAARAFGDFVIGRQQPDADTFLSRIGDLFDVLATTDPAGYTQLLADLEELEGTVDPGCRRSFEPLFTANEATLAPLASLLRDGWDRAQAARPGGTRA